MKVVAINGSPKKDGNTNTILELMADELIKEGIEVEIIHVGNQLIHGCIGCNYCADSENNMCVFKEDITNEVALKMREADGFLLGSPTYYAGIAGTMKSLLDRVFYTSSEHFKYKVGLSIAPVRRSGGVDVIHQLNNYYQLAEVIIPPSQYWAAIYGADKGEVLQDGEGMQTALKNARAMAWLLKVIDASKGSIPLPSDEERIWTNFIR
jgi:multimeric flavodoxin WrbA